MSMLTRFKPRTWLTLAVAAFAVLIGTLLGGPAANAQGENGGYVDVAVVLEVPDQRGSVTSRAVDVAVMNNGTRTAYGVEIVVDVVYPDLGYYEGAFGGTAIALPVGAWSMENDGRSFVWSIPKLGRLQREEITLYVVHKPSGIASEPGNFDNSLVTYEHFAWVTTSSFESAFRKGNNESRVWSHNDNELGSTYRQAVGNYSVTAAVDNPSPSPGDTFNFTVATDSTRPEGFAGFPPPPTDLMVKIELTGGLSVSGSPTYVSMDERGQISLKPDSAIYRNGVFKVGTLKAKEPPKNSVILPVTVASGAVVSGQCLTATLTASPPPGTGRHDDDISDNSARVCLGAPERELFVDGELEIFTHYDCFAQQTAPCDGSDGVRVRAVNKNVSPAQIMASGSVFVQIQDILGRTYDSYIRNEKQQSVTDGSTVSWQTASDRHVNFTGTRRGVRIFFTRMPFNDSLDNWIRVAGEHITIKNLGGGDPPGDMYIRTSTGSAITQMKSSNDWTATYGGTRSKSTTTGPSKWFAEFSALGTYVMDYTAIGNRDGTNGDCEAKYLPTGVDAAYCDTETYVFHVGPVADLGVEYGGSSPHAGPGQSTFTVLARNHGPDDTEGAEVKIALPDGVSVLRTIPSAGSYDAGRGVWILPELRAGFPPETLTLITDAAAGAEATATIANTEPYSVLIDSVVHSGTVFDYLESNSRAQIQARPGTRGTTSETRPGAVQAFSLGAANLLFWSDSESGDHHPQLGRRESWDIDYNDYGTWEELRRDYNQFGGFRFYIDRTGGESRAYRVRARYASRVGDWTEQGHVIGDAAGQSGTPGVTVSPTALSLWEGHGQDSNGSYRVRLDARPSDDVVISLSHNNPDVQLSRDGQPPLDRLTFNPSNWNIWQTVPVTVRADSDTVDENDVITHVIGLDSEAYEYDALLLDSVTVTIDDRDTAVKFSVGSGGLETAQIHVDEGGTATYRIRLGTEPTGVVTVSLVFPSGEVTASPQTLRFTPADWSETQEVTVRGVEDADAVDDRSFICHSFSGGYPVDPVDECLNVVVIDDRKVEGGEVASAVELKRDPYPEWGVCPGGWEEPSATESGNYEASRYSERAGGCFFSLRLNALPTGNVTVRVQADNSSKVELDTTISQVPGETTPGRLTFTPDTPDALGNWREPQVIGFWPVRDDDADDENNDFTITHRISGGGYNGVTIPEIEVDVDDEDKAGFRVEGPPGGLEAVKGDRSTSDEDLYQAVFYMFPETQPLSTVTVAMSSDESDVTLSPSRLTFTPSNWDQGYAGSPGKRVIVRAAQDADAEEATIKFTVTSSDPKSPYHGMPIPDLKVQVEDDEPESAAEGGEPGNQEPRQASRPAGLTVLAVPPSADEPTQLDVYWDWVETAAKYRVRWKTGSAAYGDAVETTTTSYTVTGLSPGTTYTVNVAAVDESNTLLAGGTASGTTNAAAAAFVIYHDPDAGDDAADRYNQAAVLLLEAGLWYTEVKGDVQDEVDRLAGVTDSMLPRFFLGDPTASDWVSQPGENNGGPRWLKEKVAELSGG